MDFTREELRILLQALYRFRGDVSGASQSEQNKYALVEGVIGKIEEESGPFAAERTRFDREMEENLSVLGRGGAWPKRAELDNGGATSKVEGKARAAEPRPKAKKPSSGASRAKASTPTKGKSAAAKGGKSSPSAGSAKGARASKR